MPSATRSSLAVGAALALASFVLVNPAHADTLNWNNVTYSYDTNNPTAKTDLTTVNGNTISIQFGNGTYFNTSRADSPSPAVGGYAATAGTGVSPVYADGGTGSKALQIFADFDNSAGNLIAKSGIPVTIFFSKPVSRLIFSFYDIDGTAGTPASGNTPATLPFNDRVSGIFGLGTGGALVAPISLTPGGTNTSALDSTNGGSFSANNNLSAQNANTANATVTFGDTPITQFTFTYTDVAADTGGAQHSATQIISLGNLTFVPEPSTWAFFAVAAGLGVWTLRRRVRQAA